MEERSDRFTAVEDKYAGYEVYDQAGEKIGKVDDLFLDENQPFGCPVAYISCEHPTLATGVRGRGVLRSP